MPNARNVDKPDGKIGLSLKIFQLSRIIPQKDPIDIHIYLYNRKIDSFLKIFFKKMDLPAGICRTPIIMFEQQTAPTIPPE
jgi:hypothetical protein